LREALGRLNDSSASAWREHAIYQVIKALHSPLGFLWPAPLLGLQADQVVHRITNFSVHKFFCRNRLLHATHAEMFPTPTLTASKLIAVFFRDIVVADFTILFGEVAEMINDNNVELVQSPNMHKQIC
jgi:hypothetical protein